MKLSLLQISGIVRYEIKRHWRRKGLAMAMIIWLVAIVWGTSLFNGPVFFQPSAALVARSPLIQHASTTLDILIAAGGISAGFAIFTLPVMVADTIPVDRNLGTPEWLYAAPLRQSTYLLGKLLGVWTAVFIGIAFIAIVSGIVHYATLGPYDIPSFAKMWLVSITLIALFVSGMATLLTAPFKSRRWAMFIGIAIAISCYIYLMPGFLQYLSTSYTTYFEAQLPAITADLCQQQAPPCMPEIDLSYAFPTVVPDLIWWPLRGIVLIALAGLMAWGVQLWENFR
ncbi:MAG: hypothetical protein GY943_35600 [Chloroflexi bacterium]|nr:hypothetical protein [Chloroflexota bacterium]